MYRHIYSVEIYAGNDNFLPFKTKKEAKIV